MYATVYQFYKCYSCINIQCCKSISCNSLLLQVISLEGWTDIMYYVQDAHSFWDWIYFVLLIVVSTIHLYI